MKQIIKKVVILQFLFFLLFYFTLHNKETSDIIINSLILFIKKVFPNLLPSLVLTELLILNNLPYYLNKYFKINSNTYIFIMSLLTGCPSNAIMVKNMLNKGNITLDNAEKILAFTQFNNPIFLYNMLILTFNKTFALKTIILNYLISFILFFFLGRDKKRVKIDYLNDSFSSTLVKATKNSLNTLLLIMGTLIVFNIIPLNNLAFKGLLELTSGLNNLKLINTSLVLKKALANIYISFGGVCILMQIKSILNDTSIKYKYYFKYRLIHLIIYTLLSCFI